MLAVILEFAFVLPHLEHNIQNFLGALPDAYTVTSVEPVKFQIGGNRTGTNTPVESASTQMVQHGQAVGQVHWIMDGQ